MYVKRVSYIDYNGTNRTEDFRFHFTQAELAEMELSKEGGFSARVKAIMDANSKPDLIKIMKKFVLDAYGVKSEDGRRFMKNDEIRKAFEENPAYSIIFMELATNDEAAAEFINGITPEGMPKPDLKAVPAAT